MVQVDGADERSSDSRSLDEWRREREREGSKRDTGKQFTIKANSVSDIDKVSRVLFPLAFLAINLVYWLSYLSNDPWPSSHL